MPPFKRSMANKPVFKNIFTKHLYICQGKQ
jgi:hypothetical protein